MCLSLCRQIVFLFRFGNDDRADEIAEAVVGRGAHIEEMVERSNDADDFNRKAYSLNNDHEFYDAAAGDAAATHGHNGGDKDNIDKLHESEGLSDHLCDEENDAAVEKDGSVGVHLRAERNSEAGDAVRYIEFFLRDADVDRNGSDGTAGGHGVEPKCRAFLHEAERVDSGKHHEESAVDAEGLEEAGEVVGAKEYSHAGEDSRAVFSEGVSHEEEDTNRGSFHDHADEGENHIGRSGEEVLDEDFLVAFFHTKDGNTEKDRNDKSLDDIAVSEGAEHVRGEESFEEAREGHVGSGAFDFLRSKAGKVCIVARMKKFCHGETDDAGDDGRDDVVGDDLQADALKGTGLVLRDYPAYNGADDHRDNDHFDAV